MGLSHCHGTPMGLRHYHGIPTGLPQYHGTATLPWDSQITAVLRYCHGTAMGVPWNFHITKALPWDSDSHLYGHAQIRTSKIAKGEEVVHTLSLLQLLDIHNHTLPATVSRLRRCNVFMFSQSILLKTPLGLATTVAYSIALHFALLLSTI